jgi:4-hydroxybenzoate polyprenyltransferase
MISANLCRGLADRRMTAPLPPDVRPSVVPRTDLGRDDWIDRRLPSSWRPFARLARLDRPIGIWLLMLPGWWSIALAAWPNIAWPDFRLLALFGIGAVVMRAAGCVINDILDRDLDAAVERTKGRPLPSGQASVRQALALLVGLLLIGLLVLVQLNGLSILLGIAALPLVAIYPLMKRMTWWPQAFLGLVFNWGALLGWAAVRGGLDAPALWLYVGGFFWTLGYDTIYAHQDREDDARIGVRSTARLLAERSKLWVIGFYGLAWLAWLAAMITAASSGGMVRLPPLLSLLFLAVAGATMLWHALRWNMADPADSLARFKAAQGAGWALFLALAFGASAPLGSVNL